MDVLILTVFVSLVLVLSAVLFFGWNVLNRSHEHDDRLTLLPLQDDDAPARPAEPGGAANPAKHEG